MTTITKAAQQALMALSRAVPKDSEQSREQLLAIEALRIALKEQAMDAHGKREAFEAWASKEPWFLPHMTRRIKGSDQYDDPDMFASWNAWKGCAALQDKAGEVPHHWIVHDFGFMFPSEDAAKRYLENIGSNERPTACYTQPAPVVPAPVDEREAFEEWCGPFSELRRSDYNPKTYAHCGLALAWDAWQARAALQSPEPQATKGQP